MRRTDKAAEMAADTFLTVKGRSPFLCIKRDGLMAAIHTGEITSSASVALFRDEDRIDDRVPLDAGMTDDRRCRCTDYGGNRGNTLTL